MSEPTRPVSHAASNPPLVDPGLIPPLTEAQRADMLAHARINETTLVHRLGPGETPKRMSDEVHPDGIQRRPGAYVGSPSVEDAEAWGNPVLPYDSSGHKVHPADAFSHPVRGDIDTARGFGGTADLSAAVLEPGGKYLVTERIDPLTNELVRTKLGLNGEILDEQREPGPTTVRQGLRDDPTLQARQERDARDQRHNEETMRQHRTDNGPIL
jgi:hypothetical protein